MKNNRGKTTSKKPLSSKSSTLVPIVGIGASAGGLDAFRKLLKAIPENSGMAYVLVQHLNPRHESMLPELLQKVSPIPVIEISDNIKVKSDHIYIIPSNKVLLASNGALELRPRPEKSKVERNLPIDIFFTSLAEVYESDAIGVVLSGVASDGTEGLKAIKEQGGLTFAQDESAAYEGMPQSAVKAGVIDFVLPPEKIPVKLLELFTTLNDPDELRNISPTDESIFNKILSLLRIRKGTDFTHYKQTTIRRRIFRRMAFNKDSEPADYLKFLQENKNEPDLLYQDLLIPVTSFFRDHKTFDTLCRTVLPQLVKKKTAAKDHIRVWVAGCSTGEEVYSIAICLKELLNGHLKKVQIFGTDISEPAIAKARMGVYERSAVEGLSSQRLQEFFTKVKDRYLVNKEIRNMCIFAVHNFLKDPPFGKMDFISCRNVLIYMEPYLQKKALSTFHYSLNPKRLLLLGKSETVAHVPELFEIISKSAKLFLRKDAPGRFMHVASQRSEQSFRELNTEPTPEGQQTDFQKTADDIILRKYTPAGVVVNETMDILHFRGNTGKYLEQSPGKPSHNLFKMAKPGLAFELRTLLHKAKTQESNHSKEISSFVKEDIPMELHGSQYFISIEVIPLPKMAEPNYLILFHNSPSIDNHPISQRRSSSDKVADEPEKDEKEKRIQQLEQELLHTRENMRSITEEQEAANEELQSANEELLSGSEELQSLNEELETSKEELQSTNEELIVVNQELNGLNEQLSESWNYANAIIATVRQPLLVLDQSLRIKTANTAFYKTFLVNEQETEGKLIYNIGNKQWNIPLLRTLLENILPESRDFSDFEVNHNFQSIGQRTILLNAHEIINETNNENLILLAIEDITARKEVERKLKESEAEFRQLANLMPDKVFSANAAGKITYLNQNWRDYTGLSSKKLTALGWKNFVHPDEFKELSKRWEHSLKTGDGMEMEHRGLHKDGEYRWHLSRAVAVKDKKGITKRWIGATTEIQKIKAEEQRKDDFLKMVSHELKTPVTSIKGYVQLLMSMLNEEHEKLLAPFPLKSALHRMDVQISRLTRLIDEILDLSRVQEDQLELRKENFDLNNLVVETVQDITQTNPNHTINISHHFRCRICGDKDRIEQVIINFINNAIKYSPENQIEIKINNIDEKHVGVSVKDYGPGIDKKDQENIFKLFYRVGGKSEQNYAGFGIGLYLANEIIQRHNGYITIDSEKGKGSEFTFNIPFEATC